MNQAVTIAMIQKNPITFLVVLLVASSSAGKREAICYFQTVIHVKTKKLASDQLRKALTAMFQDLQHRLRERVD